MRKKTTIVLAKLEKSPEKLERKLESTENVYYNYTNLLPIRRKMTIKPNQTNEVPTMTYKSQSLPKILRFNDQKFQNNKKSDQIFLEEEAIKSFLLKVKTAHELTCQSSLFISLKKKSFAFFISQTLSEIVQQIRDDVALYCIQKRTEKQSINILEMSACVLGDPIEMTSKCKTALKRVQSRSCASTLIEFCHYFYENHKTSEKLMFHLYFLRKVTKLLMLNNLSEEALVYLNYLKSLFDGKSYFKEFVKIYIQFGDCLLETNRLDFCMIYYKRALYMCWKINLQSYELKIYDRISRYFFKKLDIPRSILFHKRFIKGTPEEINSKYRDMGLSKFNLIQERIKLRNIEKFDLNARKRNQMKIFSRRIDISFENTEQDDDKIIESFRDYSAQPIRRLLDPRLLYADRISTEAISSSHKSIIRNYKNFLIKNTKENRKRILNNNELSDFTSVGKIESTVKEIHFQLHSILSIFEYFYDKILF